MLSPRGGMLLGSLDLGHETPLRIRSGAGTPDEAHGLLHRLFFYKPREVLRIRVLEIFSFALTKQEPATPATRLRGRLPVMLRDLLSKTDSDARV